MVLHEKEIDFEVHEVDLSDKSEEFLSVSPYGKVPVLRVNGSSVYRVRMAAQRGYSKEQIQQANEKLEDALSCLEHQVDSREYLVG